MRGGGIERPEGPMVNSHDRKVVEQRNPTKRPEGPEVNSHDRKVVDRAIHWNQEARRADGPMKDLWRTL